MSAPPDGSGEPITDHRQLAAYLGTGCKPRHACVGAELLPTGADFDKS